MNIKQLKRIMKPTTRQNKKVYLVSYIEDTDTTTITYVFKGQKESHLKIAKTTWEGMKFEQMEDRILITNLNGINIITNDNGWSRLSIEEEGEDD